MQGVFSIIGGLGWPELVIIGGLGILIFGRRLPEVGKSLGKGIVEFRRGVSGIENEVQQAGTEAAAEAGKDTEASSSDKSDATDASTPEHGAKA